MTKQIDKFRQAARELGLDDDEAEFDAALNKVAHAPKMTDAEIKELARRERTERRKE